MKLVLIQNATIPQEVIDQHALEQERRYQEFRSKRVQEAMDESGFSLDAEDAAEKAIICEALLADL